MAYGIWVQGIDDRTGAANLEKYASYEEFDDLYATGFSKQFCDGQTSPTAPRWGDDRMGMLWVPDEETAKFIQDILREDIAQRVATEGLKLAVTPTWITSGQVIAGLTPTVLTTVADDIAAFAPEGINAGQIQTAIDSAIADGASTADEIIEFVKVNARWMNE